MRGPVSKACTVIVNTAITDVKIPPIFLRWPWADFSLSRELVASLETAKTGHAQRDYFQRNQNSCLSHLTTRINMYIYVRASGVGLALFYNIKVIQGCVLAG